MTTPKRQRIVPLKQFIKDFMDTGKGLRPPPEYAGKTIFASAKAAEEFLKKEKK